MDETGDPDDWVRLPGPFAAADLRELRKRGAMARLHLSGPQLVTAVVARGLDALVAVEQLWLECPITRTAMRHVATLPGLRVLELHTLQSPGRLTGFATNTTLETFRGDHSLCEADLLEITACPSLRELSVQRGELTTRAFEALLPMVRLEALDLAGTPFDDRMAARLHARASLRRLHVNHTALTREGLQHIARLLPLQSLDIRANALAEPDIDLLASLPQLECLSLGPPPGDPGFNARSLLPRLRALPALKRVWLQGVAAEAGDRSRYEEHFERVDFAG